MYICIRVLYCLFYCSPSSPADNLCTTSQMVNPAQFSTFILLGDFNFCNPQHPLFSHVCDILYNYFSSVQVVPSFTHVSPNGSTSLINLALLTYPVSRVVPHFLPCHLLPSWGVTWYQMESSFKNHQV